MDLYKSVRKRRLKVTVQKLDTNRIHQIVADWIQSRREVKRKAKLKILTDKARPFEPYIPKLTSTYQLNKQSSVSVLQSFTSAVQQLCSPEKEKKNGYRNQGLVSRRQPKAAQDYVDLCSSSDEDSIVMNWR